LSSDYLLGHNLWCPKVNATVGRFLIIPLLLRGVCEADGVVVITTVGRNCCISERCIYW